MPTLSGIHHAAVTVTDLDRSVAWYQEVLGLVPVMDDAHPDGTGHFVVLADPTFAFVVGLHVHSTNQGERFSETRTGLDHIGFGVSSRAELEAWEARLEELAVEHTPVIDAQGYSVVVFRDPDNIQLELTFVG
jgi:glyoxylase I family protein